MPKWDYIVDDVLTSTQIGEFCSEFGTGLILGSGKAKKTVDPGEEFLRNGDRLWLRYPDSGGKEIENPAFFYEREV